MKRSNANLSREVSLGWARQTQFGERGTSGLNIEGAIEVERCNKLWVIDIILH